MNKVKINKSVLTGLDVEPTAWNIGQWWNWAKKQEDTGLCQRRVPIESKRDKAAKHI